MDQRLEGRIAMVTGAGRRGGIGAAIGHRLAREGATVVIADIDSSGAAAVASDIGGGRAIPVEMDVSSREHVQEVVASLRDALGGEITVLINNASVGDAVGPEGGTEEAWDRVLAVNVKGTVWCSEAVLPGMKDLRQGKIVNIASIAGHAARGAGGPYAVSKAAVLRYTKGLAVEVAPFLINVNAVCPGAVWTRLQEETFSKPGALDPELADLEPEEAFRRYYSRVCPLRGVQSAEEVAAAVAFLASDEAASITGQCIHVDGGAIRW